MPIPKPKAGQEQEEYISECMTNETMVNEFPDKEQRLAVCYAEWQKNKG